MTAIQCAVDECDSHGTENVIVRTEDGTEVHVQTCMDHVGTVGFGLDNKPEQTA